MPYFLRWVVKATLLTILTSFLVSSAFAQQCGNMLPGIGTGDCDGNRYLSDENEIRGIESYAAYKRVTFNQVPLHQYFYDFFESPVTDPSRGSNEVPDPALYFFASIRVDFESNEVQIVRSSSSNITGIWTFRSNTQLNAIRGVSTPSRQSARLLPGSVLLLRNSANHFALFKFSKVEALLSNFDDKKPNAFSKPRSLDVGEEMCRRNTFDSGEPFGEVCHSNELYLNYSIWIQLLNGSSDFSGIDTFDVFQCSAPQTDYYHVGSNSIALRAPTKPVDWTVYFPKVPFSPLNIINRNTSISDPRLGAYQRYPGESFQFFAKIESGYPDFADALFGEKELRYISVFTAESDAGAKTGRISMANNRIKGPVNDIFYSEGGFTRVGDRLLFRNRSGRYMLAEITSLQYRPSPRRYHYTAVDSNMSACREDGLETNGQCPVFLTIIGYKYWIMKRSDTVDFSCAR